MNIAFFPYGSSQNPYQKLLINAIEAKGVNVVPIEKSRKKYLSFFQLKNVEADIIHMFWPHDFYIGKSRSSELLKKTMFMLSKSTLLNRPLVYSVENLVSHHAKTIDDEKVWIQRIVDYAKGIICMSNSSLEIFRSHYKLPKKCQAEIIPHINYLSVYKSDISKSEARQKLCLGSEEKVLLSLGRIQPYKGLDTLIINFGLTASDKSVLLIAGRCDDPLYLAHLKNLAINNVRKGRVVILDSFIPDAELQVYFKAADGVILNYNDIPMNPGSVIMAMGFGNIIVAPLAGAIKDIVNAESLIGYENNNNISLSIALKDFFNIRNSEKLGALAKKRIETDHSPQIVGEKLKLFYQRVLN